MFMTSERLDMELRRGIVDNYARKLYNSKYTIPTYRKIGIAAWKGIKREQGEYYLKGLFFIKTSSIIFVSSFIYMINTF